MNWFSKIRELAGQEYERYLPTAFDESLTLLEKVNKVIETLNQIVLGVNTVAEYVDGHVDTQNEKIKQLRDDFEILKDWLENEGLEERTAQVLNEWFDNGRLAQIINNDVFDMKADKATFEQFVLSITAQLQQPETLVKSTAKRKEAITVFISDDAQWWDWANLKPIFEAKGVPLSIAVVSNNESEYNAAPLNENQLRTLEDMGWEIMSHGVNHVKERELGYDEAESEFRDSKADLISRGFKVNSHMYPYGDYGSRERYFAQKYYRSARSTEEGLNTMPLETYELKTYFFSDAVPEKDYDFFADKIDKAEEEKALLLISTHGLEVSTPEAKATLGQIIDYAKQKTRVMTLNNALNAYENIVEAGDFTKTGAGVRAPYSKHFYVGADGTVSSDSENMKTRVSDMNTYTPITPHNDLPSGITFCANDSRSAGLAYAPEGKAGTFVVYKNVDKLPDYPAYYGFNWEEYHVYDGGKKYIRKIKPDGTRDVWVDKNNNVGDSIGYRIAPVNSITTTTTFDNLPVGITLCANDSQAQGLSQAPEYGPGTIITYKLMNSSASYGAFYGFAWQEYHKYGTSVVYRRNVNSDKSFGSWTKIYGT